MNTAIVAGAVGLIGVGLGGVLQAEAARISLLREKQLAAASDLSAALATWFTTMDREIRAPGIPPADADGIQAWIDQLAAGVDVAREELRKAMNVAGRVEIVFGVGSAVSQSAVVLMRHAHQVAQELDKSPTDVGGFTRAYDAATTSLGVFHERANAVFSKPVWHRSMKPVRIILGSLVIALALGCAVWLHSGETRLGTEQHHPAEVLPPCAAGSTDSFCLGGTLGPQTITSVPAYTDYRRANWQDPLAVFVAVAGLGLGSAIITTGSRRTT